MVINLFAESMDSFKQVKLSACCFQHEYSTLPKLEKRMSQQRISGAATLEGLQSRPLPSPPVEQTTNYDATGHYDVITSKNHLRLWWRQSVLKLIRMEDINTVFTLQYARCDAFEIFQNAMVNLIKFSNVGKNSPKVFPRSILCCF